MIAVGIRELKNRLSRYLDEVRRGEVVLVTDRGKVIAEIRPPAEQAGLTSLEHRMRPYIERGIMTRPIPRAARVYKQSTITLPAASIDEALDWVRGDR